MSETTEILLERIVMLMEVQARKDFLLLTYTPDRVRDILFDEYNGITLHGKLCQESIIVANP
tara:strand:+ start:2332 stop:2517 length:186 start_codon:yes stop_codon:yes gene_type:complete